MMFVVPNKMLLTAYTHMVIYKDEFGRVYRERDGATAIEYGLIAAGVAVAIAALTVTLGGELKNTFTKIIAGLKAG